MGVPKFYRWISERYPCLSEVVKEYQIPEFDNLYLDMNGIIHTCSHPNDDNPYFRITEEKIFADIFHYLEVLFRMIQPKKLFFMAVDGVAPRAKMNQQRSRRFRSAKEAELSEKKARDKKDDKEFEPLPEEPRFDSNCITPGTPFMVRLQEQLKYFVNMKISTDSLWRNTTVILSGHETPGEGEHKIMDYIRYQKSLPGYDPNTRHCLYGLDADLIMLGLCTHDPHFSLLREEVKFGGKKSQASKRTPTPEETTFHLLHLSLLREYIDYEFQDLKKLPFYDVEKIVDDWVLMGFLMGNDFIPHLPHMHINKGGLPELYTSYKEVLPKLGGYINEDGILNLPRFEVFLARLAEFELEKFDDIYSDAKWLEGKTARRNNGRTEVEATPGPGHVYEMLEGLPEPGVNQDPTPRNADLQRLMDSTLEFESSDSEDLEAEDLASLDPDGAGSRSGFFQMEFRQHKRDYYIHKLGYKQVTEDTLLEQAECYVRAIQWNLHYYYNGCMSWSWFYPHHYAPWITDIRGFSRMSLDFEMSKPFQPFEQLLAVLPAASKDLIPEAFQDLMLNENSPIIDFYPQEFEQDLNGKQQDWEAVVLVPFIDEKRLLEAMQPRYSKLTLDEANRNQHGPMTVCKFSVDVQGRYPSPAYFPTIELNHCQSTPVHRDEWNVALDKLNKGLMSGVKLGVFFPGFPTLQYISHTARLCKSQVRVFEQASRGENTILTLENQGRPDILDVANALVGKEIWVGWPHMVEAKVRSVSNSKITVRENGVHEDATPSFAAIAKDIRNTYATRQGIEIGETEILVYACPMSGRRYEMAGGGAGRITLEKQWRKEALPYALQTVVADIPVHDPKFKAYYTVEELFKKGSNAFMLGDPCFGALGTVLDPIDPKHEGRIRLKFTYSMDPELAFVYRTHEEFENTYENSFRAAQNLGMSSHLLSRITGTVYLIRGSREQQPDTMSKVNIGLNLKFNKKSEEVAGFTKKQENGWTYSKACIAVIGEYQKMFPELFDYLAKNNNVTNDMFHELDVFEDEENLDDRVKELTTWLEQLPTHSASRQPFGTECLHKKVVKIVEDVISQKTAVKETTMQVRPKLLYLPSSKTGSGLVDPSTTFRLFDRVVNVREGFSVPLGHRGILIRIQKGSRIEDNLYDVVFDEPFTGGLTLNCSPGRGYRLPGSALLNISFKNMTQYIPNNKNSKRHGKPRAVVPPYQDPNGNGVTGSSWQQQQQSPHNNRNQYGRQTSYESRANYQQSDKRTAKHGGSQQDRNWGGREEKAQQPEKVVKILKKGSANPLLGDTSSSSGETDDRHEEAEEEKPRPPDPSTLPLPANLMKGVKILQPDQQNESRSRGGRGQPQRGGRGQQHGGARNDEPRDKPSQAGGPQQGLMEYLWQTLPDVGSPGTDTSGHRGGGRRGGASSYMDDRQGATNAQQFDSSYHNHESNRGFGRSGPGPSRGFASGRGGQNRGFGRAGSGGEGYRGGNGGFTGGGQVLYENYPQQHGGGQHQQQRGFSNSSRGGGGGGQYNSRGANRGFSSNSSSSHHQDDVHQMESDIKKMLNISVAGGGARFQGEDSPGAQRQAGAGGGPVASSQFVPLQVAKRAAQSKESSESRSSHSSSREPEVVPSFGPPSEQTRGGGGGRRVRRRGRGASRVKMAANFGQNFD